MRHLCLIVAIGASAIGCSKPAAPQTTVSSEPSTNAEPETIQKVSLSDHYKSSVIFEGGGGLTPMSKTLFDVQVMELADMTDVVERGDLKASAPTRFSKPLIEYVR